MYDSVTIETCMEFTGINERCCNQGHGCRAIFIRQATHTLALAPPDWHWQRGVPQSGEAKVPAFSR